MKFRLWFLGVFAAFLLSACAYSFTGASIPENMKTVTVRFFENNAPLVIPTLSQDFTESLKTRIRNQTRLSLTNNDGEAIFEGRITAYDIQPIALQNSNQPVASMNRLSITVAVKFTNSLKPEDSFEQSFTKYYDFSLDGASLQSKEPEAIAQVSKQLTEDIFNRAFAQW